MNNILLVPALPFSKEVDPEYATEVPLWKTLGWSVVPWDVEQPEKLSALVKEGTSVYYRGWMLTEQQYKELYTLVTSHQAIMTVTPDEYIDNHHASRWLYRVKDYTSSFQVVPMSRLPEDLTLYPCFVKDDVKSANDANLPRPCQNWGDVQLHIDALRRQGRLQASTDCLVARTPILHESTEHRVFWVGGRPYAEQVALEDSLLAELSSFRAPTAPFTMDVVKTNHGWAIMDMGDGGVSGWKEWINDAAEANQGMASSQLLRLLAAWTEWHIGRTIELEQLRNVSGNVPSIP